MDGLYEEQSLETAEKGIQEYHKFGKLSDNTGDMNVAHIYDITIAKFLLRKIRCIPYG